MKNLIILFLVFVIISCNANGKITLTLTEKNGSIYTMVIPANTSDLTISPYKKDIISITGIEKLSVLKRLVFDCSMYSGSYSFFSNLKSLEILQIRGDIKDLSILKPLKNLRILSFNDVWFYNKEIDFIYNAKLEYLALSYIHEYQALSVFSLSLNNVPKTLKYLNLKFTNYLEKNIDFFDTIKDIPCVLIDEDIYMQYKVYFDEHPNFTSKDADTVLPPELTDDNLFYKKSEYMFF